MFLCIPERVCSHNIELYMVTVELEITSYQCSKLGIAFFILKKLGAEFLVQQCTACLQVIYFGC